MPVHAASLYWDGASTGVDADGGAGMWSTGATTNWATAATGGSNGEWTNGSDAVFGGTGGVVTVSGAVSTASLTFSSPSYTITGGSVTLTGTPVIATGGNNVTLESIISGSAAISKTGTGTLTLAGSGSNTFSGTLTISEGTVKAGKATALGGIAGTIISSGATLDVNGQNLGVEAFTVSGAGVGGAGAIINTGATVLTAIQRMTMTGATTLGGTKNWNVGAGYAVVMGGHTLTKVGANEIGLGATVQTPGHIDIKEGTLSIMDMNMGGSSANTVTVRTGATLNVEDNSSFGRAWSVALEPGSKWRATLGSDDEMSWGGPVSVAGAATFEVYGVNSNMISSGLISGAGSVTKAGTGTWTISKSDYTGGTTVNAGVLRLSTPFPFSTGEGAVRGPVTVNSGAALALAYPWALGTTAGVRVNPLNVMGGLVYNDAGSGTVIAPPVLNLTGGRLETGKNSVPGSTGRYQMNGDAVVNSLAAAAPSVISGAVYLGTGNTGNRSVFNVAEGTAAEDLRIEGAIDGNSPANGLVKRGSGALSLYGQASYKGATLVEDGALLLYGPTSSLAASPVSVAGGARFGVMSGGKSVASLTMQGGSSLVLPAVAGQATVVDGVLDLAGGNITICPIIGGDTPAGTYDLIEAGSITGSGNPVLDLNVFGETRATGSVVVNGNKLQLILTGTGRGLTWNNASAGGIADGTWDMTRENFSNGSGNEAFRAFDSVTFNNLVTGSGRMISLSGDLAPAQVTVDCSKTNYIFNSTGCLVGMGSLVKTGQYSLKLAGPNSYAMTGSITAGGGLLDFDYKTISASSLTLKSGATLSNATIHTGPVTLESGSSNATLSGSAPWTKTTAGTVTLTANNKLTGPGTVSAGQLIVGNLMAPDERFTLGSGPLEISNGAAVTFYNGGTTAGVFYTFNTDVEHTFSGSGNLYFSGISTGSTGRSLFTMKGSDGGFTGPVSINRADLNVTKTGQLGSGPITLIGRTELNVDGATMPNAITITSPNGAAVGNLDLKNATLTGPITLAGGLSNDFYFPVSGSSHCTFSGPIGEAGGAARVYLSTLSPSASNLASSLTLSGASSYTGTTGIGGGLTVNLTGSLGATVVSFGSTGTLAGNGVMGPGATLKISNKGTLKVGMSGGALTVKGDVTLGEITYIAMDVTPDPVMNGPIPVLNYTGTLTGGAANLVMDVPASYRKAEFALTPGLITVDIGTKALVWKGVAGASWDSTTSMNWGSGDAGAATDYFFKGDSVVFNDSGAGGLVAGQSVRPSAIVVDNSAKDYQLAAVITGPCSLSKHGSGMLYLFGANTYTGGTVVDAGRLEVGGSAGSGPVSVAAGATLAGNGTISGPVTLAGTLDPGLSGQSSPGVLSTGPIALSGNYFCQLDQPSGDKLAVTGDLDLTGSTLTLNTTKMATGPAVHVIATYTGTLTGGFTAISGMPPGYELEYDAAGKRVIITRMHFNDWIASFSGLGDTAADGDPDRDGIANLIEYVIGGEPGASDSAMLPTQAIEGGNLVFRYKRSDSSRSITTQKVQWSADAETWTDILIPQSSLAPVTITPNGDMPDDVAVKIPLIPGSMFVRLKVTEL